MHADKEAFDVEGFEHDFGDLFSVLGSVVRRFSENESVLVRLAPQVLVDALVPVFFDAFPVADLSLLEDVLDVVGVRVLIRLIADKVVQVWVAEGLLIQSFGLVLQRSESGGLKLR